MHHSEIEKIAIIGAGIMGHGIAQVFAQSGREVTIVDLDNKILKSAFDRIKSNLQRLSDGQMLSKKTANETLLRIKATTKLAEAIQNADFITEAVPEKIDLKKRVFKELDELSPKDTILATNTSALSITEISKATKRQDRVVGTHWWNPPYLIPLVEIIRGNRTSDETVRTVRALLTDAGKKTVVVKKDVPGFIGNRMQIALMREALSLLELGIADKEDIDTAVKSGFGLRLPFIGPFETADFVGLDTSLYVFDYLCKRINRSTEPPDFLREKVERGELGVKTGKGFYDYTKVSIDLLLAERDKKLMKLLQLAREK